MEIRLTAEAKKHIEDKGNVAYVMLAKTQGCCGGVMPAPNMYIGKPKNEDKYVRYEVEGLEIYVDRRYIFEDELKVTLDNILGIKRLYVEGKHSDNVSDLDKYED